MLHIAWQLDMSFNILNLAKHLKLEPTKAFLLGHYSCNAPKCPLTMDYKLGQFIL